MDLEQRIDKMFVPEVGLGGDEQMLETVTKYSRQFTAYQIQGLMLMQTYADMCWLVDRKQEGQLVENFVRRYMEMKQYESSEQFIMAALDAMSKKGERTIKHENVVEEGEE